MCFLLALMRIALIWLMVLTSGCIPSGGADKNCSDCTPWADDCENGRPPMLAQFTPGIPVEFLEVRIDIPDGGTYSFERWGSPCTDRACSAKLAAQSSDFDQQHCDIFSCGLPYYVFSRGATGGQLLNQTELIAFLAPIDTPSEAYALAQMDGLGLMCSGPASAKSRVGPSWVDVQVVESGCMADEYLITRRTFADGGTEELSRQALATKGACGSAQSN